MTRAEKLYEKLSAGFHLVGASGKKRRLVESYRDFYGVTLDIPRWNDIKGHYLAK